MVSVLVVCAVEWRWCALLSCSVQCCGLRPAPPCPVHGCEYCCHVMLLCCCLVLWCVWCVCLSVVFVWWGILCPPSPSQWWGVGPSWVGGAIVGGGWHGNGRAAVSLASPSVLVSPSRCVLVSPSVCLVVPLNGGRCVWCPRVRIGCAFLVLCCPSLTSSCSLALSIPSSSSCVAVRVVGWGVRWCVVCGVW